MMNALNPSTTWSGDKVKTVVVGEPRVGKTSLVSSFNFGIYPSDYQSTVGVDFFSKSVFLPEEATVRLQIWDLAGHERFRELVPAYTRDAHAAVVVYDVTRRETLEAAATWIQGLQRDAPTAPVLLVGNKTDLVEERQVTEDEAASFAEKHGVSHLETSCEDARGVTRIFRAVAERASLSRKTAIAMQPTSEEHWVEINLDVPEIHEVPGDIPGKPPRDYCTAALALATAACRWLVGRDKEASTNRGQDSAEMTEMA